MRPPVIWKMGYWNLPSNFDRRLESFDSVFETAGIVFPRFRFSVRTFSHFDVFGSRGDWAVNAFIRRLVRIETQSKTDFPVVFGVLDFFDFVGIPPAGGDKEIIEHPDESSFISTFSAFGKSSMIGDSESLLMIMFGDSSDDSSEKKLPTSDVEASEKYDDDESFIYSSIFI